jgi:hypothetical protein
MYDLLGQSMAAFVRHPAWERLVHAAEHHGLSPLLHKHLSTLGWDIPRQVRRQLQTLALRSRHASAVRSEAVAEIVRTLDSGGITLLLVKGIALCHLAYSEPGLRPMRDVDLLVGGGDTTRTAAALADLGYVAEDRDDIPDDYYHLVPMTRVVDGLTVTLEVHRNLLPYHAQYPRWPLERSLAKARLLPLDGLMARTLCLEDMLWHVCLHGFQPPLTYEPFRYIHVADAVGLVERYLETIDWQMVRHQFPAVDDVLSCLHWLTPWEEPVISHLAVEVAERPVGVGVPYHGWPLRKLGTARGWQIWRLTRDTLCPSPWWLQLYYGRTASGSLAPARWVAHPRMLLRWIKAYGIKVYRDRLRRWQRGRIGPDR